jgi:serine/threonine-protein kinase HipA
MINLNVYIEINGTQVLVGRITGTNYTDSCFAYDERYIDAGCYAPISISLPFQMEPFSASKTKNLFESLLPEGFSRRAIADWIKTDPNDYITILTALGKECLGAIKITDTDKSTAMHYEELSLEEVKALAAEGATKSTQILMETHLSLTGASGKVGLLYDSKTKRWFLPKGEAPSTHIVKQSHVRLNQIVLNEQLCMLAAKNCGIDVPESFIIDLGKGTDDQVLFATKRYDRALEEGPQIDGIIAPLRLHQEDFAQALGIAAADKYESENKRYLKRIFSLIQDNCQNPIEDKKKLLERIVFNVLIGNTDCHVKNYSLLYSKDLKSVSLAPAYDIVATQVYNTTSKMSFYIGDEIEISKIERSHFISAADDMGMSQTAVGNTFDRVADKFERSLIDAADELAKMGYQDAITIKEKILSLR